MRQHSFTFFYLATFLFLLSCHQTTENLSHFSFWTESSSAYLNGIIERYTITENGIFSSTRGILKATLTEEAKDLHASLPVILCEDATDDYECSVCRDGQPGQITFITSECDQQVRTWKLDIANQHAAQEILDYAEKMNLFIEKCATE